MLNFDFLDKSLGIVSQAHFVYGFLTNYGFCYDYLDSQMVKIYQTEIHGVADYFSKVIII